MTSSSALNFSGDDGGEKEDTKDEQVKIGFYFNHPFLTFVYLFISLKIKRIHDKIKRSVSLPSVLMSSFYTFRILKSKGRAGVNHRDPARG